jgi:ABC-2 type transport system ATP-binding protein
VAPLPEAEPSVSSRRRNRPPSAATTAAPSDAPDAVAEDDAADDEQTAADDQAGQVDDTADTDDTEEEVVEEVEAPQPISIAEVPERAVLVASKLGKDYGDGMGLVALDLEIDPGELVMLVGPNGAGKSTFLGLTAGLIEPTNGDAWVQGSVLGSIRARAATSYLPDTPVLYDDLSLNEHIEYIARLHNTEEWEDYADDLLEIFNLTDRADDLPSRFSRGLKQKTALILGLIRPFSLLLIDEPFVGLDTPGQEALVEILADVSDQGAAVLCSTHQMDLTPKASRCVGLRDGELSYDGPASAEKIRALVGG